MFQMWRRNCHLYLVWTGQRMNRSFGSMNVTVRPRKKCHMPDQFPSLLRMHGKAINSQGFSFLRSKRAYPKSPVHGMTHGEGTEKKDMVEIGARIGGQIGMDVIKGGEIMIGIKVKIKARGLTSFKVKCKKVLKVKCCKVITTKCRGRTLWGNLKIIKVAQINKCNPISFKVHLKVSCQIKCRVKVSLDRDQDSTKCKA